MAIYYVDLVNGNDGNLGTAASPFLTLNKAQGMPSSPHNIRIAKTNAPTIVGVATLFGWTNNSALITTSTDLTGTLVAGDYIGKPTARGNGEIETFFRIISITSTVITLNNVYYGTTQNTTGALKIVPVITGIAGANTCTISISGHIFSGGWNLVTEIQDGETWAKSNNTWSTVAKYFFYSNGYDINISKMNIVEQYNIIYAPTGNININYCTFYSYLYTFYWANTINLTLDHSRIIGSTSFAILLSNTRATITNNVIQCPGVGSFSCLYLGLSFNLDIILTNNYFVNSSIGIYIPTAVCSLIKSSGNVIDSCVTPFNITATNYDTYIQGFTISNTTIGLSFGVNTFSNAYIKDCIFINCSSYGVYGRLRGLVVENCNFISCGYGIFIEQYSNGIFIKGCNFTTPTTYAIARENSAASTFEVVDCTIDFPSLIKAFNIPTGQNKIEPIYIFKNSFGLPDGLYYPFGSLVKDTVIHGSIPSMKFKYDTINMTNYTTRFPVVKVYVPNAVGKTLSIWMKVENLAWNGIIIPEWRLNGKWIKAETEITQATPLDTTWRQFSWTVASGLITTDGILSMQFQIRCNNYAIYWDDVIIS